MSELFAWGSEQKEIDLKLYEQLLNMSTIDLLNKLDEVAPGDKIKNRKQYEHIIAVIADKLTVPLREPIGLLVSGLFGDLETRVDELERNFKAHRHDTTKSYSEKPAW